MNLPSPQSNALHKWYGDIAEALNDAGYEYGALKKLLDKRGIGMPFTKELIKEYYAKVFMEYMFNKHHTKDLTPGEAGLLTEAMNKSLADNFEIHVPFPKEGE